MKMCKHACQNMVAMEDPRSCKYCLVTIERKQMDFSLGFDMMINVFFFHAAFWYNADK